MSDTTQEELPALPEPIHAIRTAICLPYEREEWEMQMQDYAKLHAAQCISTLKAENERLLVSNAELCGQVANTHKDADGEPARLCSVCEHPVRYGSRHHYCGTLVMRAEAAQSQAAAMAGLLKEWRYELSTVGERWARDFTSRIDAALATWKGKQ